MTAKLLSLDTARPHVTAPACCETCKHEWVAVALARPNGEGPDQLECPNCGAMSDAARYARVKKALDVIDDLRARVVAGDVIAFAAVGVEPDDGTYIWMSATENVSRLRMIGALNHMAHSFSHDSSGEGM